MNLPSLAARLLPCLLALLPAGCTEQPGQQDRAPPLAEPRPTLLEAHGHVRKDDYHWLAAAGAEDPELQALLAAENRYTAARLAHLFELRRELHHELASRYPAEDSSVPVRYGRHDYFRRFVRDGDRPVYLRRSVSGGAEQVLLDLNRLGRGHPYYAVANWAVSPDERLLAYVEDRVGAGRHTLRIKDLEENRLLELSVPDVAASLAWATGESNSLFHVALSESHRPHRVLRLDLDGGTEQVYLETDPAFAVHLHTTRSQDFIVILSSSGEGTEARLLSARRPALPPVLMQARSPGHEYNLQHDGDTFFIRTNWRAAGFRIMTTERIGGLEEWRELVPATPGVLLEDFEVFADRLVLQERRAGRTGLRFLDRSGREERRLAFAAPLADVRLGVNPELDADRVRFIHSSLTSPSAVHEVSLSGGEPRLVKRTRVPGFRAGDYLAERLLLPARDGALIPVSLVYRRDTNPGTAPLLIYGYGAYGLAVEPVFDANRLSLLDRGFIYAIAHVRGGGALGPAWHEAGRRLEKWRSFHDFIDATQGLTGRGYGDAQRVFALGASAGGLLLGVVANEAPELFLGLVMQAPFTDLLTSLLDASLPLTAGDLAEWGDPGRPEDYRYLLSYSPYDRLRPQAYPHILVTAGLRDARVGYHDPVKWVQKLRALKTDRNQVLLDMEMHGGHAGPGSQQRRFRRQALTFAFLLDLAERN